LEPDNRAAKHQLNIAVKKQADGATQERSMFAGMFQKFAQQDLLVCLTLELLIDNSISWLLLSSLAN